MQSQQTKSLSHIGRDVSKYNREPSPLDTNLADRNAHASRQQLEKSNGTSELVHINTTKTLNE